MDLIYPEHKSPGSVLSFGLVFELVDYVTPGLDYSVSLVHFCSQVPTSSAFSISTVNQVALWDYQLFLRLPKGVPKTETGHRHAHLGNTLPAAARLGEKRHQIHRALKRMP